MIRFLLIACAAISTFIIGAPAEAGYGHGGRSSVSISYGNGGHYNRPAYRYNRGDNYNRGYRNYNRGYRAYNRGYYYQPRYRSSNYYRPTYKYNRGYNRSYNRGYNRGYRGRY
jgi:hypothetical protein